ncbi:MAG: DUF2892 domain-containing protein [Candidatus Diapherotrites archaeon]
MQKNVGDLDKSLRIILGLLIIVLGIYFQNWLGVLGLIPLITGLINYCPAYSLLGFNTCKK